MIVLNKPYWHEIKISPALPYRLSVLRLDVMHPVISGNKWFKLKYNLEELVKQRLNGIITTGGAYSNHLHAVAELCHIMGLKSIGIIRGEKVQNSTLDDVQKNGMEIHFCKRSVFKNEKDLTKLALNLASDKHLMYIPMGGSNFLGEKGASEIAEFVNNEISHLYCACGTGTTYRGLLKSLNNQIKLIGIETYLNDKGHISTEPGLYPSVHPFGKFGKTGTEITSFISWFSQKTGIELDLVYTSRLAYGILNAINEGLFPVGSHIGFIHSGGLQGNRSVNDWLQDFKLFEKFNCIFDA